MDIAGTISEYARGLAEPIKSAYADYNNDGSWFCNKASHATNLEKNDYSQKVNIINEVYSDWLSLNPDATLQDKANYLIRPGLEGLGDRAECLDVYHNVNPDSVATLSPQIQDVLKQFPDRVYDVAPTLVEHATVPEFGNLMSDLFASTSGYLVVGTNAVQEKAAELSSATGDIGLLFGLGIAGITATIYGIKKLSKENLFE